MFVVGSQICIFFCNKMSIGRSRSCKVVDFGTNREGAWLIVHVTLVLHKSNCLPRTLSSSCELPGVSRFTAGFNWLFRRRLWFCLDVGHHRLLGYRTAPPAVTTTTTHGADPTNSSPPTSRPSRDGTAATTPRSAVSIDLRSASIYPNPIVKYQFTVAWAS